MKKSTVLALAITAAGGGAAAHFARAGAATPPPAFEMSLHEGESLPVAFNAGGDLFELSNDCRQTLTAKRNVWLRIQGDAFELSLDGTNYRPLSEVVGGDLSLATNAEGKLSVGLQTKLK